MNRDNVSIKHVQKNRIFDLKSTFQDSIYQNNIHNCPYFEEHELNNKLKSLETNQFSILSLNIQSLPGKFEEFKTFLATTFNQFKPSVIALQEIWNKPQNLEFILENYHPLHFTIRDKQGLNNNSGGGVGLWVENSFSFEPVECISIFIPRVFESQFIKVKTGKNKYILVGNIYRPNSAPYANIKYFNQTISDIFSKIKSDPNLKNVN